MEDASLAESIRRYQLDHTNRYAAIALLFYTGFVYLWSVTIYPLGSDYSAMAAPDATMPRVVEWIFRGEMAVFGGWVVPYHIVNIAVLYVCAYLVYLIGREAIGGPAWLSLLAAVFFMASPIHRDAVFLVSGIGASLPALAGLFAVYLGLWSLRVRTPWALAFGIAVVAAATLTFRSNAWIPLPLLFWVWLIPRGADPEGQDTAPAPSAGLHRVFPLDSYIVLIGTSFMVHFGHGGAWDGRALSFSAMWVPVYMALYPLGFLPETVRQFHGMPWLAWVTAGIAVVFVLLVLRKAKSRTLVWAVASALAVRLGMGNDGVDLVHLAGGRHLLLANAFVFVGVCDMFRQMIRHPKWHRPVVTGTTLWCLILFGMQIHGASVWRSVGRDVRGFQDSLAAVDEPLGLLPDVGYLRKVPAFFGESVRYATPFSTTRVVESLVRLNVRDKAAFDAKVEAYGSEDAVLGVRCKDLGYALGDPYTVDARETATTTVGVTDATGTEASLAIRPKDGELPGTYVPGVGNGKSLR